MNTAAEQAVANLVALFGDLPPDDHRVLAMATVRHVASAFPSASIGIAGSVARNEHHSTSDIDLVVASAEFARDGQIALQSGRLGVALVLVRAGDWGERRRRWRLQTLGEGRLVWMIHTTRVLTDPSGALDSAIGEATHALAFRRDRDSLLRLLREEAGSLASTLAAPSDIPLGVRVFRLRQVLLEIRAVQAGIVDIPTKKEERARRKALRESDVRSLELAAQSTDPSGQVVLRRIAMSI